MFDPGQTTPYARACALLRDADRALAEVVLSLAGTADGQAGLPAEFVLRLDGRRPGWEARALMAMAEALRNMPITAELLRAERLSFPQVRAICRAAGSLEADLRARCDALVGSRAESLASSEPERIVDEVEDLVARANSARELAREDRVFARRYLHIQPQFGGGAHLSGEVDSDGMASICSAIEAAADSPEPDLRGQQRMDALVAICDGSLNGGTRGPRPRPRLLASVQLSDLASHGLDTGARLLAEVIGAPVRLGPIASRMLGCDAEVRAVLFDGAQPIAVSDARKAIPDKVRIAVAARDGGCRFPGCGAPVAWCDIHHLDGRGPGASHDPGELVLLCRRCHRRVHRYRWTIDPQPDGSIGFTHRARSYSSHPRARGAPALE